MIKPGNSTRIIKICKIIFIVYVITTFILAIVGFRSKKIDLAFERDNVMEWGTDWAIYINQDRTAESTIPIKLDGVKTETVIIRNKLPEDLGDYNCLLIESKRQDTNVYINNGLRRSLSSASLRQGRSLPSEFLIVPLKLSDAGGSVAISFRSNSVYSGNIGTIYLGDETSIIMMLLHENIVWLSLIIVLVVLGIFCFAFKLIYRRSFDRSNIFAYLGSFCLFTSFYCFNQLRLKQCFIEDLPMLEVFGYCSFMLVPYALLMIAYGVSSFKHVIFTTVMGVISLANFIIQQLHHNINNTDYFTMQGITQFIVLTILIGLIVLHKKDKENEAVNSSAFVIASNIYVLLSIFLEVVIAQINSSLPPGSIYLVGFVMYALNTTVYCFISLSKENEGKKKTEMANQAKSAFLASMSHEIRTPINAIIGINEIISRETTEESTRKYSSNIAEASNSLLFLVNDILDYSKIESGKLEIVNVEYNVPKFLEEMTILAEARMQNKNLDFKFDIDGNIPCQLYGDIARIKQVCINLLTNAIKYTKEGGFTFTIKCMEATDENIQLYFSVKDTGIGIREEDCKRLMNDEFIRLDPKKNYNIEGTGLGLSITTRLLKLMGSELQLSSVYGKGSDFYFIINQKIIDNTPIKDWKGQEESKPRELSLNCPDAKILVVDDTKTNLIVMKGLLKQFGASAVLCDSGSKCIEECRQNKYDIIFLDIMMPVMDGSETLKKLREENLISDTPVIALTANAISGAREMYMSQGFNEYMSKPFKMSELEELLVRFLKP